MDDWKDFVTDDEWFEVGVRDGEKHLLKMRLVTARVISRTETAKDRTVDVEWPIVTERPDRNGIKYDYYLSNADDGTTIEEFVWVILGSHRVEDYRISETRRRAKSECGLADYEVQTWHGWHHHVTLSLVACWFLTKETLRNKKGSPLQTASLLQRLIAKQLRRHVTRLRPDWTRFDVQRRSLRKEQAYFYHYRSRNILPPRRLKRQL